MNNTKRLCFVACSLLLAHVALALEWTTGGSASWYVESTSGGVQTFQSGVISDDEQTWLQISVSGPGKVSFQWKASSESGYDKLYCSVDGTSAIDPISGLTGWCDVELGIASGSHTIRWTYEKDGSCEDNDDSGWVRNITIKSDTVFATSDNGDGTVTITGATPTPTGALVLPSEIGGKRVTSIGDEAFAYNYDLTEVTIPEGVLQIGMGAFHNCYALVRVTMPSTVTDIGISAFGYCKELTGLTLPADLTKIEDRAFIECMKLTKVTIPSKTMEIGKSAFQTCTGLTSVTVFGNNVTIGETAFKGCTGLTSVTFGASVRSIGYCAFLNCSALQSVQIPASVKDIGASAFNGCSGLTSVTISDGVASIGDSAFMFCSGLLSVTIPASVAKVGSAAFRYCEGLTSAVILGKNTSIGDSAFQGCEKLTGITLSAEMASIASSLFYGCKSLKSVTIPSSVTNIGNSAFAECGALTSVIVPPNVVSIGDSAFIDCSGITNVTIRGDETTIGNLAFRGCSGLVDEDGFLIVGDVLFGYHGTATSVVVPSVVRFISSSAFEGCSEMTSVTVPPSVARIGNKAFYGCDALSEVHISDLAAWCRVSVSSYMSNPLSCAHHLYVGQSEVFDLEIPEGVTNVGPYLFSDCTALTSVTIPSGVTNVCWHAFSGCSAVTNVTLPECVGEIGSDAFSGCNGLKDIIVPNGATSIGQYAFYGCGGLTNVTIGVGVASIGYEAFYGCGALKSISIPPSVTRINGYAFYNCNALSDVHVSDIAAWCYVSFASDWTSSPMWRARHLFVDDEEVLDLVIPDGVTRIGAYAFYGCDSLTSVTIPSSVTNIGSECFCRSANIRSVTVPGFLVPASALSRVLPNSYQLITNAVISPGSTSIAKSAFSECRSLLSVTIPTGVTNIGEYAFYECAKLSRVRIPESVASIGYEAFYNCCGLTDVVMPMGVVSLGDCAFKGCSGLQDANGLVILKDTVFDYFGQGESVTIPSSVRHVDAYAFSGCNTIKSVTIPAGVTSIDRYAFSGCTSLQTVSGLAAVKEIEGTAFVGTAYWKAREGSFVMVGSRLLGYSGTCPAQITIPEGITEVCGRAFMDTSITNVTFPNTLTEINAYAFYNCPIKAVVLPSGIKRIGYRAFCELKGYDQYSQELFGSMGSVTMENVKGLVIEDQAFYGQPLGSVTISGENVTIGNRAFYQTYDLSGYKRKNSGCAIRLTGSYIRVGDEAFSNWMHRMAYADLSGVSSIGSKAFSRLALYYRSSDSAWWDLGDAVCVFSSALKHIDADSFYSASIGRIYLDSVDSLFAIDNWLQMTPFYCYYRILRTGSAPGVWGYGVAGGDCANVEELSIPEGVTHIPYAAFCNLMIRSVTVPASVRSIDDYAFDGCASLTNLVFLGDAPTVGTSALSFYQPKGTSIARTAVVLEGSQGWDDDGDGKWQGMTLAYRPQPTYAITYENTRGLANTNPTEYRQSEEIVFAALPDEADARFVRWDPVKIDKGSSGERTVTAVWETKTLTELAKCCGELTSDGDALWRTEWTGEDWILRSGAIGDRQQSTLTCVINGGGVLTFKWKVSSECAEGWQDDYLSLEIDGVEVAWIGGEKGWTEKCFELTSGSSHTLKWTYAKDKSGASGDDCGRLSDIVWTPTDTLPDIGETPSAADVAAAVADATDPMVSANIDETNYNDFRTWAGTVKAQGGSAAGAQGVMEAQNAWMSYALGQNTLLDAAPTDEDLLVETFKPAAESGKFDFTVSVKDVEVGSEAAKENLKKVFGLEGAATLDDAAFSSDKVDIEFATPVDGKVKFTAGSKDANTKTFFMKVKLNP